MKVWAKFCLYTKYKAIALYNLVLPIVHDDFAEISRHTHKTSKIEPCLLFWFDRSAQYCAAQCTCFDKYFTLDCICWFVRIVELYQKFQQTKNLNGTKAKNKIDYVHPFENQLWRLKLEISLVCKCEMNTN